MKNTTKTAITAFVAGLSMLCIFKTTTVQASSFPTKYDMNLKFDSGKKMLSGKEDVYIENNSSFDLKTLEFHLYADSYNKKNTMPFQNPNMEAKPLSEQEKGDISISKVTINGKSLNYTEDNQLLKVFLDKELKNGESLNISIQFNLKLPNGVSRLGYSNDVYSFTNWYPILSMYDSKENKWDENSFNTIGESNYSDTAEYNVDITVPKDFNVVSTGKESESSSEANTKVMNLKAKDVRDFVMIMSPYFKSVSKEIDGIKINSYYLEKDNDSSLDTGKKVLDYSVDAVKFFSQQFGKYPYDELDMVETYFQGGAMEYPQLVQMPKYSSSIENDAAKSFYMNSFIKEVSIHEVGHQWWYVTVGNNEFKEPFLDESLTSFSTAYFFDKTEGLYSEGSILDSLRTRYVEVRGGGGIKIPSASSSVDKFDNMGSYNISIYKKGALIFEDLRTRVGEAKFKEVLQAYFKEYKFKNSSIDGLLSIIEQKCGSLVKEAIKEAIYSDEYNPENLKVTNEDYEKLSIERVKTSIKSSESSKGFVIGSLFVRAAEGEKVIVVTPSSLSETEKSLIDDNLKNYFRNLYGKILIKTDKETTEADFVDNNIMILGNPQNNKLFDSVVSALPISINKNGLSSKGFTINNENTSGFLATKNPKNEKKVMGIFFWTKDNPASFFFDPEMNSQFRISVDNKQFMNGDF